MGGITDLPTRECDHELSGRTHGVGEYAGNQYDVVIRFTDTFVRREGRWQAIESHASGLAGGA